MHRILIIDDDRKLQALLEEYLGGYDYAVSQCYDGPSALEALRAHNPELVILDIMLPERNGFDVLRDLRNTSRVPVIMLTAKGEDADRILGLELGADDYLPKPFNPRELLARIRAVLRRSGQERDARGVPVKCGGFVLEVLEGTVSFAGKKAEVSSTEIALLEVLMKNPNRVLSRDDLMNITRGRDAISFERSIDVHISRLRKKLEQVSGVRMAIKTVWGRGYMFVEKR